jgi:hypothetical protein
VQAAGHLVTALAELPAGVQHGQDQGHRRDLLGRVLLDRDAAGIVGHLDAAVGHDPDVDRVAEAGHRLVDRVVHDLGDQVVQAALTGRPDVHARPLPNRLEALQHGDRLGVVLARNPHPRLWFQIRHRHLHLRQIRGRVVGGGFWRHGLVIGHAHKLLSHRRRP